MEDIKRVILIVLDSVGIGELPDAAVYGDKGSNTLGHIARDFQDLQIPNLVNLGLGNIDPDNQIPKAAFPIGAFGKAVEQSPGKDTTTGHWEIAGLILEHPFPTYPNGFPPELIEEFEKAIGVKTIGNYSASGTVIINELGDEHVETKCPIVYTSADSVFQIAMHEKVYPIEEQYRICKIARRLLKGKHQVGRVIARPFIGRNGNYIRTKRRKDFSVQPPYMLLDAIEGAGLEVNGVGKIVDIFSGQGVTNYEKTANNQEGVDETLRYMNHGSKGLIFTNLVDFDMLYGHRRDIPGYAKCLMEFDKRLPEILNALQPEDLLLITADHGNDPSFTGSDHTREYVPILAYGNRVKGGTDLGVRNTFADIAATIAEALDIDFPSPGTSFLSELSN
ncbi:MAG: phosphopentomutase [Saprospiraceae bacterium]|nr:phosphopentomutase [Saprospiraceae bacterium]